MVVTTLAFDLRNVICVEFVQIIVVCVIIITLLIQGTYKLEIE